MEWTVKQKRQTVSFTLWAIFINPEEALGHLWLPGEFFLIGSQWGSILFNQHLREKIICINLWPTFAVCFDGGKLFTIWKCIIDWCRTFIKNYNLIIKHNKTYLLLFLFSWEEFYETLFLFHIQIGRIFFKWHNQKYCLKNDKYIQLPFFLLFFLPSLHLAYYMLRIWYKKVKIQKVTSITHNIRAQIRQIPT